MKLRTTEVARRTGMSPATVRLYARLGLIPCELDSAGARLFDESVVEPARELFEQRMRESPRYRRLA